MAKVITTELQHSGASGANITLDSSKNVTCENNLTVDGTTTLTGAVTLPDDTVDIADLSATGTASSSTFLRGDNAWAAVSATGRILQVQQYTNNGRNINATNSYAGVGLSDIITPTAATSKIMVLVSGQFAIDSANASVTHIQAGWQVTWNHSGISESVLRKTSYMLNFPEDSGMDMILQDNVNFSFIHHPNTTNAITYDVQCKCANSSASIEFISGASNEWYKTITLIEIGAPDTTNLVGEP